jgi:hypothetical protein
MAKITIIANFVTARRAATGEPVQGAYMFDWQGGYQEADATVSQVAVLAKALDLEPIQLMQDTLCQLADLLEHGEGTEFMAKDCLVGLALQQPTTTPPGTIGDNLGYFASVTVSFTENDAGNWSREILATVISDAPAQRPCRR